MTNSSFTERIRERETGRQNDCVNGCDVDLSKWRKKAAPRGRPRVDALFKGAPGHKEWIGATTAL